MWAALHILACDRLLLRPATGLCHTVCALLWRTVKETVVYFGAPDFGHFYELGLNSRRMYAFVVEKLLNLFGDLHIIRKITASDVRGSDDSVAGQLPHVKLVDG